ncbi:ATP-binding protein [Janibacter melonis]|uniref:ATP-binding protein n=1 Tax=Janibacter melonis TaxID=262209 RepID=UPI0035587979
MHAGSGVPIEVAVGTTEGRAVVEVRDHGVGMDDETAARVFERFFRADKARSRAKGGPASAWRSSPPSPSSTTERSRSARPRWRRDLPRHPPARRLTPLRPPRDQLRNPAGCLSPYQDPLERLLIRHRAAGRVLQPARPARGHRVLTAHHQGRHDSQESHGSRRHPRRGPHDPKEQHHARRHLPSPS